MTPRKFLTHHKETIKCTECGEVQDAKVEHTSPFYSYVHDCVKCGYTIMESEWNEVDTPTNPTPPQLREGEVEDGWVKIEDGLPDVGEIDEGTKVLTYPHYINCFYGKFINVRLETEDLGFYSFDGEWSGDTKIHGVTHWRNRLPLPNPPKQ